MLLGVGLNGRWPQAIARVAKFTPALASLLVALIVGVTLAHSAEVGTGGGMCMCVPFARSCVGMRVWMNGCVGLGVGLGVGVSVWEGMAASLHAR